MAGRAEAQELADRISGKHVPSVVDTILAGASVSDEVDEEDLSDDDLDTSEEEEDELDDEPPLEGEDDLDDEEDDDEEEDEVEDDEVDDDPDDEPDLLEFDEKDVIEVKVDGEIREVTLGELIQNYSGEGAISKRVKEATERLRSVEEREAAAENDIQGKYAQLLQTVQSLDEVLFEPLVKKPDPKLRQRNMQQYLMERDAYEEDQKRIKESREMLQQAIAGQTQKRSEARQQFRMQEFNKLAEKVPDLKDEKKAPKVQEQIMNVAAHYGFTPQQVAEVDLHGIFLMAIDAGKWLELQNAKNGKATAPNGGGKRKLRKLRSGGVTAAKTKAQRNAKVKKQVADKARASGSVGDVTNMLLANVNTREQKGKRRGR